MGDNWVLSQMVSMKMWFDWWKGFNRVLTPPWMFENMVFILFESFYFNSKEDFLKSDLISLTPISSNHVQFPFNNYFPNIVRDFCSYLCISNYKTTVHCLGFKMISQIDLSQNWSKFTPKLTSPTRSVKPDTSNRVQFPFNKFFSY